MKCANVQFYQAGFDFDHRNSAEKYRDIAKIMTYSWKKSIMPEIDKCRLLCSNCHRIHAHEQSKNENVAICRKRKRYYPVRLNKEELQMKIHNKGERPTTEGFGLKIFIF